MLIWGFRVVSAVLATFVYACENCGHNAAHHLSRHVRKFTLFFVPLFAVSTRYRDTCTACGRVVEVSQQQAEAAMAQPGAHRAAA